MDVWVSRVPIGIIIKVPRISIVAARRQSEQSRLELGLCFSRGPPRANDLCCGCSSRRRKAFRCARGRSPPRMTPTRMFAASALSSFHRSSIRTGSQESDLDKRSELLIGDSVRAMPCRCRGQLTVNFAPIATGKQMSAPASNDHESLVCAYIGRNICFEDFHVSRFHFGRQPMSRDECASDSAITFGY